MIEVPVGLWQAAVEETGRVAAGFTVPIRKRPFTKVYWGLLAATLASALGRKTEDFGGVVTYGPHNLHLTRLKNLRLVP